MITLRKLHSGPEREEWFLARDAASDRVFIRYQPPDPAEPADFEVGEFLIRGVYGPEHQALLRLIGTLVDGSDEISALRVA